MKPLMPKKRFNPFTRGILCALGLMLLGLLLCAGQSPALREFAQGAMRWQPVMREARPLLGHFSRMPGQFGVLSFVTPSGSFGGENGLSAYAQNINETPAILGSAMTAGRPAHHKAGRPMVAALRYLARHAVRLGVAQQAHGLAGLSGLAHALLALMLSAITG